MATQPIEANHAFSAEQAGSFETSPPHHEEGFSIRERMVDVVRWPRITNISGATVKYTEHVPLDTEDVTDETWTIVAHGFGGIQKAYYELADTMAAHGMRTATVEPVRSMGLINDVNPVHYREPIALNSKALWAVMRDLHKKRGAEVFDILGHSLGGRSGTEVARTHPDFVRNLALYGSVGVNGHRLPEMALRLPKVALQELPAAGIRLTQLHGVGVGLDFARYVLRNPARTVAEGVAAGTSKIHDDVQAVREAGVKTSKVYFPKDGFFHPDSVAKYADGLFDMLHLYDDPNANHVALQTDAQGVVFAHLAITKELRSRRADLSVVV